MSSFRFLHTADIHLDSPLRGLTGAEDHIIDKIRSATRDAFEALISYALDEQVDFVVIAGDLYDGDWPDYSTGLFFAAQMGRLNQHNIGVFVLHGNHDAESQITKQLVLPDNVQVFGSRKPQTFTLPDLNVALHGQSFAQRDVTSNLALDYPVTAKGAFNIGVLHTALAGRAGHANYAPCSVENLENKGYDYWALGHVHQAEVVHEFPHIVFPGNLQGRHSRETGAKGATLVTVSDGRVTELNPVSLDVVRWHHLNVDVSEDQQLSSVTGRISEALRNAVATEADDRMLVCRVFLQGQSELHDHLTVSHNQLLLDARASALGLGEQVAWIEKLVVDTTAPGDPQMLADREDALGELQAILNRAPMDAELLEQLHATISALIAKLPADLRDTLHDTNAQESIDNPLTRSALDGSYADLVRDVMPYLNARLATPPPPSSASSKN